MQRSIRPQLPLLFYKNTINTSVKDLNPCIYLFDNGFILSVSSVSY